MKYEFKGIIKGSFSYFQSLGLEESAVESFQSNSLHELLDGLAIDEWTFVLKVNGRRIKNAINYIKRNGLNPKDYQRCFQNGVNPL